MHPRNQQPRQDRVGREILTWGAHRILSASVAIAEATKNTAEINDAAGHPSRDDVDEALREVFGDSATLDEKAKRARKHKPPVH